MTTRSLYSALCSAMVACAMLSAVLNNAFVHALAPARGLLCITASRSRLQRLSPLVPLQMAKGKKGGGSGSGKSSSGSGNKGFSSNANSQEDEGASDDGASAPQTVGGGISTSAGRASSNDLRSSIPAEMEEPDSFNDIMRAADPSGERAIPPEIVFFGEPRQPPPVEAAGDVKYYGPLLMWARHATAAPRNSEERMARVYPLGGAHADAATYRLNNVGGALSFESIYSAFTAVMDDLEASKSFLNANMDIVPSTLFLRALTARKLSLQSRNDLDGMERVKAVRNRYILAHDQLFFPLNLEITKAETRVMTYLARLELAEFSREWDAAECSLHFTTLLAARITWDHKVRLILEAIKEQVRETVEYMASRVEEDLNQRRLRRPALTAKVYANASKTIEESMPAYYSKVHPEVRFLHETYDLLNLVGSEEDGEARPARAALRNYALLNFCPKNSLPLPELLTRLRLLDATLAGIEDVDYVRLRLKVLAVTTALAEGEPEAADVACDWYHRFIGESNYGFETYEPDEVPSIVQYEQRIRDTGSAFTDFAVQVLQFPTKYTDSLSGQRKKAAEVGDWLVARDRDNWDNKVALNQEERLEEFRRAYMEQTRLRKEAEGQLTRMISNRLDAQERAFGEPWGRRVTQLSDE